MRYWTLSTGLLVLVGCKTYTVTPDSLRDQLTTAGSAAVHMLGPAGDVVTYTANNVHSIHCLDKAQLPVEMPNSPSIEVRVTTSDGKRHIMYFDRLALRNDTLIGYPSRFSPNLEYRFAFSTITKVELQNGGKRMRYID